MSLKEADRYAVIQQVIQRILKLKKCLNALLVQWPRLAPKNPGAISQSPRTVILFERAKEWIRARSKAVERSTVSGQRRTHL